VKRIRNGFKAIGQAEHDQGAHDQDEDPGRS
jgi:hypothetical protein